MVGTVTAVLVPVTLIPAAEEVLLLLLPPCAMGLLFSPQQN